MADARLVATNPEDSSLVAVACTPQGLLKTEGGAEGPPGPKGDPGPQGDPGPKGDPGTDGTGIPPTDGVPDGYVLQIVNSQAVWAEVSPPIPGVIWSNYVSAESGSISSDGPAVNGFDGDAATSVYTKNDGTLLWNPPVEITIVSLKVSYAKMNAYQDYDLRITLGDVSQTLPYPGSIADFINFTRFAGETVGLGKPMKFDWLRTNGTKVNGGFSRLEINGTILLDGDPVARTIIGLRSENQ